jgi:hypothetical protein
MFSEESKLLIAHWDAVEDIKDSEQRLSAELTKFLHSFEDILKQQDWWSPEWSFYPRDSAQVYVSHENWLIRKDAVIWIGVHNFNATPLFGTDTEPVMYVWVTGASAKELASALVELVGRGGTPPFGELDKGSNNYVVKKSMPKYLPDEVDGFRAMMTKSLLEFFEHYAAYEPKFTKVLQQVVDSKE